MEIVREMVIAFEAGDREAWRRQLAPDVVWDNSATRLVEAQVHRGHAGIEKFFTEWLGAWDAPTVETTELIDAEDCVVAVFRWSGVGKSSGVRTEQEFYGVYDVRDGLVARFRGYDTREEALEAAGLSE